MSQVLIYGRQEGKSERTRIAVEALRAAGYEVIEIPFPLGLSGRHADVIAMDFATDDRSVLHMLLANGTHVWQGPLRPELKVFEYNAVSFEPVIYQNPSALEGHGAVCMCIACARQKRPKNSYKRH